jgi:hypothetical protein
MSQPAQIVLWISSAAVAALVWAYGQRLAERKRRRGGTCVIALGTFHGYVAGFLAVVVLFGALFLLVQVTHDREFAPPRWLPEWITTGLTCIIALALLGVIAGFPLWAGLRLGPAFARRKLVYDRRGIRFAKWGHSQFALIWKQSWDLIPQADIIKHRSRQRPNWTEHVIVMLLRQNGDHLHLRFEASAKEAGGLPPCEPSGVGHNVVDRRDWLRDRLEERHEKHLQRRPDRGRHVERSGPRLSAREASTRLMHKLGFTQHDLEANRQGRHEPAQVASMKRNVRTQANTFLVIAGMSGVAVVALAVRAVMENTWGSVAPGLVVGGLIGGFCGLIGAVNLSELRAGITMQTLSGRVAVKHYQQSGERWLRIGDEATSLSRDEFEAFEDGAHYHVHLACLGSDGDYRRPISAERFEPDGESL